MKLHETVTYPSLEGVSLCGSFLCSLCVPTGFGGKAGSEVSMVTSSPRVCCQLSPWWETGLEMEGLKLQPGAIQGFSDAHGCPYPIRYECRAQGAEAEPLKELGFSCVGDGCLYLGWFSDRGLWVWGFTFVLVFTFSLCVPWLEAGSGTEGWFHTTELASLLLAMWVSVLELVSLLLNGGRHVCPGNGYLHSDQR